MRRGQPKRYSRQCETRIDAMWRYYTYSDQRSQTDAQSPLKGTDFPKLLPPELRLLFYKLANCLLIEEVDPPGVKCGGDDERWLYAESRLSKKAVPANIKFPFGTRPLIRIGSQF